MTQPLQRREPHIHYACGIVGFTMILSAGLAHLLLLPATPTEGQFDVHFPNTDITLGPTPLGDTAAACYTFINNGPTPVAVHSVKTSCGCSHASSPFQPIGPGQSGTITLTIHTHKRPNGPLSGRATVFFMQPGPPPAALSYLTTIYSPIELQPNTLHYVPELGIFENPTVHMHISGIPSRTFDNLRLYSASPDISAQEVARDNNTIQCKVAPRSSGIADTPLLLRLESIENSWTYTTELPINVKTIAQSITFSPVQFFYLRRHRGRIPTQQQIRVTSSIDSTIELESIQVKLPDTHAIGASVDPTCPSVFHIALLEQTRDEIKTTVKVTCRLPALSMVRYIEYPVVVLNSAILLEASND